MSTATPTGGGGSAGQGASAQALSRGGVTPAGSAAALSFLGSRWSAVEAAANDAKVPVGERPEIHREPAASKAGPTTGGSQPAKQGGIGGAKTPAWGGAGTKRAQQS
ncbi:hypothetical protein FA10DRAFT_269026 [Acaromyces ingoldii]|uniref:Uncharacterized protein n=1 Tax=Acaromyces ingoldii TaxID=215250 RepID=A0A316YF60_9BASI|nr:hypothetical protein FA10DRAFT_269026 [Acaromyces ingoldii]PWN87716.1 hypothetical protein FA10DRAFT_269026 [Acaromyces ingoldii]